MCCKIREDDPDTFPRYLPLFPLDGVLLLPRGQLPLNIFETRYIDMIDDALSRSRLIGMIQPCGDDGSGDSYCAPIYDTGCAGKIVSFEETGDGRYLITLRGVARFQVAREHEADNGYRRVEPLWQPYRHDTDTANGLDIERDKLNTLLKHYFEQHDMQCCWQKIDHAPDERLITALCMICPFASTEKQALLEAETCQARVELFMAMLEMAICEDGTAENHH